MVSVWASAGNLSRSVSELGLTNVEQQRMLRSNNVVTSKMMSEKDARANEARELLDKENETKFKDIAATASKQAAQTAVIGSVINLIGGLVKGVYGASSGTSSWSDVALDAFNGLATVVTKYLDYLKAGAEKESVEEDLRRINKQRCEADDSIKALEANPYA